MSYFIITIGIVSLLLILFLIYKLFKKKVIKEKVLEENEQLINQDDLQITKEEILNKEIIQEEWHEEDEEFYELNTDKIRYSLYYPESEGLNELSFLYKLVIIENLWIREPFHSKFYEFLLLINDNDSMIIDPLTKVITMNVRDKNNKVQRSKSYQVFSSKEIVMHVIPSCMHNMEGYGRHDKQNILISIFMIILKQSIHYQSNENFQNTVNKMLKSYKYEEDVRFIIQLIKEVDERVYFIQDSISDAFKVLKTFPYNDSEELKPLEIREQLPQKLLQKI